MSDSCARRGVVTYRARGYFPRRRWWADKRGGRAGAWDDGVATRVTLLPPHPITLNSLYYCDNFDVLVVPVDCPTVTFFPGLARSLSFLGLTHFQIVNGPRSLSRQESLLTFPMFFFSICDGPETSGSEDPLGPRIEPSRSLYYSTE